MEQCPWIFALHRSYRSMTTIGKRFLDRSNKKDEPKILDSRVRSILNTVLREQRGRALEGYLMAMGRKVEQSAPVLIVLARTVLELVQDGPPA